MSFCPGVGAEEGREGLKNILRRWDPQDLDTDVLGNKRFIRL